MKFNIYNTPVVKQSGYQPNGLHDGDEKTQVGIIIIYIYISGMSPYTLNYMDRINRNNNLAGPEPQKLSWCPTLRSRVVPEVVTDWQTPMSPVTTK